MISQKAIYSKILKNKILSSYSFQISNLECDEPDENRLIFLNEWNSFDSGGDELVFRNWIYLFDSEKINLHLFTWIFGRRWGTFFSRNSLVWSAHRQCFTCCSTTTKDFCVRERHKNSSLDLNKTVSVLSTLFIWSEIRLSIYCFENRKEGRRLNKCKSNCRILNLIITSGS